MQFNLKKLITLHVILVVLFIVALIFLAAYFTLKDYVDNENYWQSRILLDGRNEAYADFVKSVEKLESDSVRNHKLAHLFGGVLYNSSGIEGLDVCDGSFSYGCFHEFLGRAISDLGIGTAPELNEKCIKALGEEAGFCQHGLGHGIQAYFGYSRENLEDALSVCSKLPDNDPVGGCRGGIFMEYNMRTMLAEDSELRRDIDPLGLCKSLSGDNLFACSYWIQEWWIKSGEFSEENVARAGALCEKMTQDKKLLRACFNGVGNTIASRVDFDYEDARLFCGASSSEPDLIGFCWEQAETNISLFINNDAPVSKVKSID